MYLDASVQFDRRVLQPLVSFMFPGKVKCSFLISHYQDLTVFAVLKGIREVIVDGRRSGQLIKCRLPVSFGLLGEFSGEPVDPPFGKPLPFLSETEP
jgi:hypothetical protein